MIMIISFSHSRGKAAFFCWFEYLPHGIDHRQLVQPTPGEINKKLEIQLAIELRDVVFITPTAVESKIFVLIMDVLFL